MYTQTCLLWRESKTLSYNGWLGYVIFYYNHWSTLNFKVKKVKYLFHWDKKSVNLLVWNKCTNSLSVQLQMLDLLLLTHFFKFSIDNWERLNLLFYVFHDRGYYCYRCPFYDYLITRFVLLKFISELVLLLFD